MKPWIDRINRVLVVLLGLLLFVLGIAALLLGFRVFGAARAQLPVVDDATSRLASHSWFWPVVGGCGLVLAVLCLWWLIAQLRIQRLATLELDHTGGGDTTLDARALTDAIRDDAEGIDGVSRAHARMIHDRFRPQLALTVWLSDPYDLAAVRQELDNRVVARARQALGVETLRTWLRLEVDPSGQPRVR